jgi:hypothetical protein
MTESADDRRKRLIIAELRRSFAERERAARLKAEAAAHEAQAKATPTAAAPGEEPE